MAKFPYITSQNSLTWVKWPKFPDIFSNFPDFSLTQRKFSFSLTYGDPVEKLVGGFAQNS